MRRLAWTFAARIGDKYQIRLSRSIWCHQNMFLFLAKKSIPKDAKLYANEKVLSEIEIYKTKSPLYM